MDFFEKAHVVKGESTKKEHKSDEVVKKQLKKMLTGYKQRDSKLIKQCDDTFDRIKMHDDSSSVSCYSDLNLSNSSNEADTTRGTVGSDSEDYMNSDMEEPSHVQSPSSKDNSSGSIDLSKESISEYDDNIQTLSDNITAQVNIDSSLDSEDAFSIESSVDEYSTDSHESEFDADGALANKIMEKLKNKGVVLKRGKKRKLDAKVDYSYDSDFSDKQKYKEALHINDDDEDVDAVSITDSQCTSPINAEEKKTNDSSINDSSEFISIAPSNVQVQSLDDLLGEYRHPTVKNIPEGQNLHSTNNSGTFSVENISVEDIQLEDEDIENLDLGTYNKESIDTGEIFDSTDLDTSYNPMSESTNIYDDTIQSEETSDKEMSLESVDTNFKSPIKVYYGKTNCIFLMKNHSELYIHGKVVVKALVGTLETFGYTLSEEPCEVYAPNYNYAFSLKSVGTITDTHDSLFRQLKSEGLTIDDAEEIVSELDQFDGVVSLSRLNDHKLGFVENNITTTDLFKKTSKNVENCFKKAVEILGCSLYLTRPYKVFEELSCCREVLQLGLENQSRGIICGGKGVGKSTFLRYCVNRLLTRGPVLVVDLDPGQAEFTVAGNVSATVVDKPLLGPNFTHLKTPKMMLNIGMINTMDNPRRYAAAVSALISHCNSDEQLKSMPWVVNTMGMCNAIGLKFITQVILQTQPTYLLQINTRNPKKRFDRLLNPENIKDLYEESFHHDSLFRNVRYPEGLDYSFFLENHTDSSPKNNSSLAPRDERYLNFLAYFSELLNSRQMTGLLGIRPYEVNLGDLRIGLNIKISANTVAKVINGKIIALCQLTTLDNAGKVFTLRDKPLLCHGHGLIRGIDLEKEILYVITPTPVDKLPIVDTLVYADWVPELRGQEKHLPKGIVIPYRATTMYQKRQLMFTPRRRFNPIQLLKMSRNT